MATFPATIGGCLKELAKAQAAVAAAEAKLKPLSEREAEIRQYLFDSFKKTELDGARGSGLSLSVVTAVVPTLADWDKFLKFALRKGNGDLLQRSVNTPAWRERLSQKVVVPGVTKFERVSLRVSKA